MKSVLFYQNYQKVVIFQNIFKFTIIILFKMHGKKVWRKVSDFTMIK